nr:unnamed protein product [Digitaria exilis]
MRDFWELPPEEELVYSGLDWLLLSVGKGVNQGQEGDGAGR